MEPRMDLPTLETDRLSLRKCTMADAKDLFEYASDPDVAKYTSWLPHQTIADSAHFLSLLLAKYTRQQPADWAIVDKRQKKMIGTCGFVNIHSIHKRAEIGYALAKPFWRQGIMTEAVGEVIRYGFEEIGLNRIEARAEVRNIGSWRVMEKNNMQFEGVLRQHLFAKGEFHDVRMYAILRDDYMW